jgi:hypothetical protein
MKNQQIALIAAGIVAVGMIGVLSYTGSVMAAQVQSIATLNQVQTTATGPQVAGGGISALGGIATSGSGSDTGSADSASGLLPVSGLTGASSLVGTVAGASPP